MDSFIQWLSEYKSFLVSGITLILTILLLFIKKRPKTLDDFLSILDEVCLKLPELINRVECPGYGLSKKKEVRSSAVSLIRKVLGRELSESELSLAYDKIDNTIEAILSTPQKKL